MTRPDVKNFREIGDTTEAVWQAELKRLGSPWSDRAAPMRAAASPHSALCLAMGVVENRWGATGIIIKPADNNPLSLRPWDQDPRGTPPGSTGAITASNGGKYLRFKTPEDCIREWKRRLVDDRDYKGGVYVSAITIEQMIDIFCPPGDIHPVTGLDSPEIGYPKTVRSLLGKYAASEGSVEPEQPVNSGGSGTAHLQSQGSSTSSLSYPTGMDRSVAMVAFGKVTGADGQSYSFNEQGPVSRLWLKVGTETGRFPAITRMHVSGERRYFIFSNGMVIWKADANTSVAVLGKS